MRINHINPDHYLETDSGRVWTPERSKSAWENAYHDFESSLKEHSGLVTAYIVFGVQGSGKSTWVNNHKSETPSIYFDAALPAKKHRISAISIAKKYARKVVGVWIKVPLSLALSQNQRRENDKQGRPLRGDFLPSAALQPMGNTRHFLLSILTDFDPENSKG